MTAHIPTHYPVAIDAPAVPEQRSEPGVDTLLSLELTYTTHGTAVLNVSGEVDMCSSPRLRELVQCRLRSELRALVVDLSEVSFLSIDGAQMLAYAASFARHHDTELRIVPGDSRAVRRVLLATGLDKELPLH